MPSSSHPKAATDDTHISKAALSPVRTSLMNTQPKSGFETDNLTFEQQWNDDKFKVTCICNQHSSN